MNPIPETVLKLWRAWDLRIFILSSLLLQILLMFLASLRKRQTHKLLSILVWCAYLLADWVAAFALGLISNSQGDSHGSPQNDDLLAFWAPFLLLHLGGPDTITAFALEDNELWLRHLFGLLFQLGAACYVFIRSLPTKLWVPTILMFVSGLIKYAERTRALYLASFRSWRDSNLQKPNPGPNYEKLMERYESMNNANLPTKFEKIKEPETNKEWIVVERYTEDNLDNFKMMCRAYEFFTIFKGLIVNLVFTFNDRKKSRDFFLMISAKKAFRVIEIELTMMYEVLYTKALVVHSWFGYFLRFIYFSSTLTTFLIFLSGKKYGMDRIDICITYALLIGAISLDCVSLLMLIFSHWNIVSLRSSRASSFISAVLTWVPILNTSRWSLSISQLNLITTCMYERPKWINNIADYLGLTEFLDEIQYKSKKRVTKEVKKFIFCALKRKSRMAVDSKTAKEICSARGDCVLIDTPYYRQLGWSVEVEYDESLLLWHIATEICYRMRENDEHDHDDVKRDREFCKLISDYMLYLLVMQPKMMSAVAGMEHLRYRDTCAEASRFFLRCPESRLLTMLKIICGCKLESSKSEAACMKLFSVDTTLKPADVKGDWSQSVLFDAVSLAKDLQNLKKKKWNIMSQVWLELMSYAASHSLANTHAQQLSKGGELLTFVWLLMTHLGMSEQFRKVRPSKVKLIVEK